jgi:hypothetical protein
VDWNLDGKDDIIVGTRMGGIAYFERQAAGGVVLERQDSLTVGGEPLDLGHNSSPCVAYWNGDALPDLLSGRTEGIPAGVYLFENTGSPGSPAFSFTDTVRCSGEPITIYHSYPCFHDMDLDGLDDLVVGSDDGMARCFLNVGSPGAPLFEEMVPLLLEGGTPVKIFGPMRSTVADWNDDGIPDLVTGDMYGFVSVFPGVAPQSAGGGGEVPGAPVLSVEGNPSTGVLSLTVGLPQASGVLLHVYDLSGRTTAVLDPGVLQQGSTQLTLDITGAPPGIYLVRCTVPGAVSACALVTLL